MPSIDKILARQLTPLELARLITLTNRLHKHRDDARVVMAEIKTLKNRARKRDEREREVHG